MAEKAESDGGGMIGSAVRLADQDERRSILDAIEKLPLDSRATKYAELTEDLRAILDDRVTEREGAARAAAMRRAADQQRSASGKGVTL